MRTDKLEWVENGPKGAVALTPAVKSAFKRADARARGRIERYMKWFATLGQEELHSEAFKFEGRFPESPGSQKKVAIYAFKGWKVRIYGTVEEVNGIRTFVGTEIDVSKKQNKANRTLMLRAAIRVGELKK